MEIANYELQQTIKSFKFRALCGSSYSEEETTDEDSIEVAPHFDEESVRVIESMTSGGFLSIDLCILAEHTVLNSLQQWSLATFELYMVVFNTQEFLQHDGIASKRVAFWLNSIGMHGSASKILLIGTRHDKAQGISDNVLLLQVDALLRCTRTVEEINALEFYDNLCFFPVDNMSTCVDRAHHIRSKIEEAFDRIVYI